MGHVSPTRESESVLKRWCLLGRAGFSRVVSEDPGGKLGGKRVVYGWVWEGEAYDS